MFSDVPNLACTFGYSNASCTLKADLTADYVCRMLNHMDGWVACVTPRLRDGDMVAEPLIDFPSGYVTRALDKLPKRGFERALEAQSELFR